MTPTGRGTTSRPNLAPPWHFKVSNRQQQLAGFVYQSRQGVHSQIAAEKVHNLRSCSVSVSVHLQHGAAKGNHLLGFLVPHRSNASRRPGSAKKLNRESQPRCPIYDSIVYFCHQRSTERLEGDTDNAHLAVSPCPEVGRESTLTVLPPDLKEISAMRKPLRV